MVVMVTFLAMQYECKYVVFRTQQVKTVAKSKCKTYAPLALGNSSSVNMVWFGIPVIVKGELVCCLVTTAGA
jgi:hypothetical protein